jgi:hypothetical protein
MHTTTLRVNGYSVTADGKIECHREAVPDMARAVTAKPRYGHERTAVIRIDLEKDSKPGRELVVSTRITPYFRP